ncbi:MAG TPA: bifunctional hydroxymethylpyrimidine kinase/phosphomethylpyrimidine kinase [Haliangiales bacterium]|nr:bifunctional hydroxymethylpyrimidine kinase/phosphomethylpyrimidine kinase [Haliangiales bacterium]
MKQILVIAGLDPTGGAGILADARVAALHGARAVGVVTAHTVQDTSGVRSVVAAPAETVGDEIAALLGDVEVDAVKIGMIASDAIARAVARALAATAAPVVWDPVLLPSRGVPLFAGDLAAAAAALLPEARLVTPNLHEASALSGVPVADEAGMRAAARAIPAAAVLVTGGHLAGDTARDVLRDGDAWRVLDAPRVAAGPLHGTGCVLSSAIACRLAAGEPLADAVAGAKAFVLERIRGALAVGRGARCLV